MDCWMIMFVDAAVKDWLACHGYSEVNDGVLLLFSLPVGSGVASGNNIFDDAVALLAVRLMYSAFLI